jgi:teichuronic acid biosynthesis glycosyltransferase TuaC
MKVAIVSAFFPSAPAPAIGVPLLAQIPYLKQLADIQVISPRATYPPIRFLQPRKHLYRPAANGYDLPGADAIHVPFYTFPVIGRALNGYLAGRAVLDSVREFRPDVIIGYTVYPDGYGALWVGRKLGIPVILVSIGSDVRYVADRVQLRLVKSALRRANYLLTVSHELRQRAIDLGADPNRSLAILNGCDTGTFRLVDRAASRTRLGIRADSDEVVYVGRLVPLKGLRELFEALAIVRKTRPSVELTCIGEGPLEAALRERSARPDLAGAVRFVPPSKPGVVAEWMAAANLTCLASYSEGCPNVVIESLACGRAVVASNVGGVPELVNSSNGVLIQPHDINDLARGLIEALERHWDEPAIAAAAQRSWMEVARATISVCEQVVRTGSK